MLTPVQAAYIAGILDGEGSFSVRKSKSSEYNSYVSEITVGSTTPDLTNWLHNNVPGSILHSNQPSGNREVVHAWRVSNKDTLIWLLYQVNEFLVVKKVHAQLLLDYCVKFCDQIAGTKLTESELAVKDSYCTLFTDLNSRGVNSMATKQRVFSIVAQTKMAGGC